MTDTVRNKKRPSIYLNPPLERVGQALRPGQSLSARLGEIAERYELICSQAPGLSEQEQSILKLALNGTLVEPLLIKYLDREIEDSAAGEAAERSVLADKIRNMTMAQRVAAIERLGF